MADAAAFWDRHADGYAKSPIKDLSSYERCLERTRARLTPEDEALELGCGTGTTALRLAPSVKAYLATDVSGRMIEIGREKAAADGVANLRFERAGVLDAGREPGRFDVVLAFNLLHLVEDLDGAVARVHALLRPGGRFISKTICLSQTLHPLRLVLPVARAFGFAPYVRSMRIAEVEGAITRAGFEVVETGVFPVSPPSRFVVAERR